MSDRDGVLRSILNALNTAGERGRRLQGPLNAVFGDLLDRHESSLAIRMRLLRRLPDNADPDTAGQFEELALDKGSPPPGARLSIFIHGLGSSERTWELERKSARGPNHYASLIERDTKQTPLFLRYNTGRHISSNGRDLAELLERLVSAFPVDELNLIGHSMGGLLLRSAGYYGSTNKHRWVRKLRRNILLGSPLLGAHQEQVGKLTTDVLNLFPVPGVRLAAKIIDLRSAGIQDLGFGYLRDEDWQTAAPGTQEANFVNRRHPAPLLTKARYFLVIGSLSDDPDSIAGRFLGDGVVHSHSARGKADRYEDFGAAESFVVRGLAHNGITGDVRVYRRVRDWLRGD